MKLTTLVLAALLLTKVSSTAQNCPVNTKIAFISILASGSLDPRTNYLIPKAGTGGHLSFAFVYPDTCIMHYRPYLRLHKEALALLTRSFLGRDSLKGYTSADFAFFNTTTGLHPLEMWREYFSQDDKDTFSTPQKRLDLLRCIMPFASLGEVRDTSVEITIHEIPCFTPALDKSVTTGGYSINGYLNILAYVIHDYVLKGTTMVTNITYIRQNGVADISRYDMKVPYDFMLQNALTHPN